MLHRRILKDDRRGVSEALNETANGHGLISRGKHWIFYSGNILIRVKMDEKDVYLLFRQSSVLTATFHSCIYTRVKRGSQDRRLYIVWYSSLGMAFLV